MDYFNIRKDHLDINLLYIYIYKKDIYMKIYKDTFPQYVTIVRLK